MNTDALRKKILDLAIRGKLVPQDPDDEPASALLECIRTEKQQMVKDGKLKKKDIKNDTVIYVGEDNLHYEKFQDGTVKCIEDEIPFELPEGWEWTRLGSVFFTVTGSTPSTKDTSLYGIDYPFYKPADLDAGYKVFKSESTVSEKGYRSGRPLPPHSVLVTCIGATIGKTGYIHNAGICNQQINAILPNTDILSDYTYFCICSQFEQQQILINSSATTLPILNKSKFDNLLFPVPPHEQQLLIVDKIQGMLTLVNKIQDNQEFLKDKIIATKSKILDLAIRGELVPQNPDDEPASVLLERIRAEKEELIKQGKIKRDKKESVIFKGDDNSYYLRSESKAIETTNELPYEIPDSWEWARIGDVLQVNPRNKIEDLLEVSFIPMPLIDDGFSGKHTSEVRVWEKVKSGFTPFMEGDIGIAKITPCFENRKSVVFRNLKNGYGAGTTELHILRPYASTILPEYILAYVKSSMFIGKGKQEFTGAVGQQRIGKDYVENSCFPIPPFAEQTRIVEQIHIAYKQLDLISNALL
ncbi:restriction endonuclease subunit S [Roseburia hominis]|uniref:restriction endonuclease subunit S n=1 Tax=Roseburia hominis TaxID=301301 RepID=UPI002672CF55|nr:restriction endonuclease subunit S [Roseburia hominis]